jgi:uncharacterized membrane protein
MIRRKKTLIFALALTILYLFFMTYFFIDYSKSLDSYNSEIYDSFNTLQNLIHKVHNEDSQLYKILTSNEILSSNFKNSQTLPNRNHTSTVIGDLLNIKENEQFSSERLASTIDEYYSLEKIREQIIQLHKLNIISSDVNYDLEIRDLIEDYEIQIQQILSDIHDEIEINKQRNLQEILNLKKEFIIKELVLLAIFFASIFSTLVTLGFFRKLESKKNEQILDNDMQRIISYVKKEVSQGNFPTIKELKFYLKISHPTLLLKLSDLEKRDLISIKKKGRNKYLFIK